MEEEKQPEAPKAATPKGHKSVAYYQLFKYSDGLDKLLVFLGVVGSVITGAALPFFSVLLSRVTNAFLFPNNSNLEHTVNQTALYFLLLGIGIMVASFTGIAAWTLAGTRITTRIKSLFLDAALRQDFNFYDTKGGPGQLLNDLTEEADAIMEATGPKAARFIQNVSTAVAGFIIAFVRGWEMTLVMLSLMPAFLVISAIAAQMTRKLKVQDNAAYARANTISVEALANVRTVHASNAEEVVLDSYHNSLSGPLAVGIKIGMIKGGIIGSYLFITYAAYALAIWYGSLKIADGTYNGGTVVNVLFAAILGAFSLAGALPLLQTFSRGQEAASRLYAVLDREPLISLEGGDTLDSVMGRIELKSVAFAYPSQPDILVFRDLNLVIEAGTNVALVGESGSGKSTIVGLVERFYDPLRGAVLLDGVDIKTLNLRWLRSKIGLVQQEPVLFAGSVSHNIMLGTAGATQEQAEDAARAANIHEFICSLPDGYDTMVGEKGTQLSGGQKQRLAIARALLKDPRILLLDEATSALDTKSERVVQKALDAVMQNRTSIIIAHRLSTVVRADAIAVLKDGVIVEQGKHTELMERGGIYSSLAKAQNLGDVFAEEEKGQESVLERFETMLSRAPERDVRVGVFLSEMSQGSMRTLGGFIAGAASVALRKKEKESEKKPPPEKNKNWSLMPSSSIPCCGAKKQTTAAAENGNVEPKVGGDAAEPLPQGSHFQRIAALNASEWKVAVLGVAAAAGMGAVQPVYAYVLSKSVNTLYNPDIAEMKSRVSMYSGIFVGIGGAALIFALGMFGAFSFMGHKLAVRVRLLLFRSMLRQEVAWFDKEENSTGVLVSRLAADSRAVKGQFGDSMGFLVQNATTIIVALSLAFATNWNLAIVVVAATPTVVITALVSMEYVSRAASAQTGFVAKADGRAAEALYNLRTVVTLGIEPDMSDSYNEKLKPALRAGGWHGAIDGGGYGIGQFFVYCMYSLAFWYGGKLVTSGNASPNDILQVFLPIFMAAFGAGQAQMYFPDVARGRAAATRVFSIVDRVPVIDNLDEGGDAPLECEGHLEFERVRFAYPSRPNLMVFKAFSLDIPPRTSMALVGESGSGKSTVVGLIQRFYAPLSGVVMLDGHDISTLNMRWLRSQVGLVGQEPVLFSTSVRDNITYGAGKVQDEQVQAAAAAAFAADFIDALPNGYDTLLGSGGVSLSGGQKQRLAIARALVKDPKIFLLDEATSALDVESEKLVTLALDKVMQGKTSIIVAHKLVTVERADCISVLQRGRIVEQGTHLELSQSNGIYAQLLRIQQGTKSQTRPPALEVESLQGEVPSHPVNSPSTPDSPP